MCQAIQTTVAATITINGKSLPVDVISCVFDPDLGTAGTYVADLRALARPLPKGHLQHRRDADRNS